jgi:hypothetical protein
LVEIIGTDIFSSIWLAFLDILPNLVVAIAFIILGYILGLIAKAVIVRIFSLVGIDEWFEEQNLLAAIGNKNFSEIAGTIAKWYLFFIFIKQAVEIVNLVTLNQVLGFWIQYALLAIVAIGVIIGGLIIGRFARNAIEATGHSLRRVIGLMLELIIAYIAFVMGISIVGLPTYLLESAFIIAFFGMIFALSLMIGLGFGLALKDEAKTVIKELKKSTKKKD